MCCQAMHADAEEWESLEWANNEAYVVVGTLKDSDWQGLWCYTLKSHKTPVTCRIFFESTTAEVMKMLVSAVTGKTLWTSASGDAFPEEVEDLTQADLKAINESICTLMFQKFCIFVARSAQELGIKEFFFAQPRDCGIEFRFKNCEERMLVRVERRAV